MASIRKRADGTWQATVYVGRDANGKKINKYITRHSEKECKKAARDLEQEIEEGSFTNVGNTRVVAWIEKYMEINKNSYAPSTRVLYQSYLKNHWEPFFKQIKLKDLNEIHLKQLLNGLLEKMSATSARRCMSALRTMINDVLKKKSPAREIKLPPEDEVDYTVPTTKQFEQIHKAVLGTRDEPIVLLAGWCGLRRQEIFALKIGDLDFQNNKIKIDEGLSINEDNQYEFKETKSKNGFRTVAAPESLMALLKQLAGSLIDKDAKVKKITAKKEEKEIRLFTNRPDNYSSYWAKLVKRKKLPKIRFYDLRHYHATWLYENDIPDHHAAKRLGHDVHVLKSVYQHLGLEREKELDKKITGMHDKNNLPKKTKTYKLKRSI